jgi:prepilin-type processing-associated H-X9-DG protein
LIELLVVVAIVAVLAALLMPALKRAREMGQAAACAGNLRQIGAAALCYASDHDGFVMAPAGWRFWQYPSTTGGNPATALSSLSDFGYLGPPAAGKGSPVFLCPWLQRNRKVTPKNSSTTYGGQVNYSVTYLVGSVGKDGNWSVDGSGTCTYRKNNAWGPARLSDVRGAARCFLAGDASANITTVYAGYDTACNSSWGGGNDRLIGNVQVWDGALDLKWKLGIVGHGGPNLLFWDGHVERYAYPPDATSAYPANPSGPGGLNAAFPWNRTTVDGNAVNSTPW